MTNLHDIKVTAGGTYICTALDSTGYERWEPYVNVYVRVRALERWEGGEVKQSYSIAEHLEEAGWIPPEQERLDDYLCLARAVVSDETLHHFVGKQCLLRRNHEGHHVNGWLSWVEGIPHYRPGELT